MVIVWGTVFPFVRPFDRWHLAVEFNNSTLSFYLLLAWGLCRQTKYFFIMKKLTKWAIFSLFATFAFVGCKQENAENSSGKSSLIGKWEKIKSEIKKEGVWINDPYFVYNKEATYTFSEIAYVINDSNNSLNGISLDYTYDPSLQKLTVFMLISKVLILTNSEFQTGFPYDNPDQRNTFRRIN